MTALPYTKLTVTARASSLEDYSDILGYFGDTYGVQAGSFWLWHGVVDEIVGLGAVFSTPPFSSAEYLIVQNLDEENDLYVGYASTDAILVQHFVGPGKMLICPDWAPNGGATLGVFGWTAPVDIRVVIIGET